MTYELSKFLKNILNNLVGKTIFTTNNSLEFVTYISDYVIDDSQVQVSLDVVSLFTTIPINLARQIEYDCLSFDDELPNCTNLTVSEIMTALDTCFDSTTFVHTGVTYQQVFGTPMGSPLSPFIANKEMEDLEQTAIKTFHSPPMCWLRYVDDVYAIIKKEHLDDFHQHLNSMQASIKFTREKELNGTLSFLDVTVTRKHDGSLITSVYRKPTYTSRYLSFDSHHPLSQKLSIPRTLLEQITSHWTKH